MTAIDDSTLARLGHLNHAEFLRESARWSGADGEIAELGGVLLVATGSDFPVGMNAATRVDDRVPGVDVVTLADQWFGERGRGHSIAIRDTPEDADLLAAAEAAGMFELMAAPEMVCRAKLDDRTPPEGVELRWATAPGDVDAFVEVVAAAYETLGLPATAPREALTDHDALLAPHVHTVLALLDGRPVGAAQTILSHGIAGVYWVATVDGVRNRGIGEAVTHAVTNRAFDCGAGANTLQASPMGEPIYARMGYETVHRYRTWTRFEPLER